MNRPRFLDRLTGQWAQALRELRIAGRYAFLDGDPPFVNSLLLDPGDLLIPAPGDRIYLEPADGAPELIEGISYKQFPDRMERQSLIAIGERLKDLESTGANWLDWLEVSPLVVGNLDRTHLTPFERALEKYGWHLAQVCAGGGRCKFSAVPRAAR